MRSLLILAAAMMLAGSAQAASPAPERVPGRVVVRWRTPAAALRHAATLALSSARAERALAPARQLLATEPTDAAADALIASLRADPDVLYAEPDYVRRRSSLPVTPSDPLFPKQWALPMIKAPEAWSRTTGSSDVTVAVVDTGVVAHPELVSRIVGGYDFITDPASAADGDGRDPDFTDTGDSTDQSSALHGTHVAGIVAASANNQVGVAGLDWSCKLLIVRALGVRGGTGVDSDIADAIRWAAGLHVDGVPDNATPAQVINMSFGGTGFSQAMQDAIHDAIDAGAIVVAAAGNNASDARDDSPAGLDGVIAVGAVTPAGTMAPYSNYGSVVTVMAPGGSPEHDATGQPEGVISTIRLTGSGYTYTYYAGTSQASPFVAATVSLMKGLFPRMSAGDAKKLLLQSANPSAQCKDPTDPTLQACGGGLRDVESALAAAATMAGGDNHEGNVVYGGCAVADAVAPGSALACVALALALLALRRRVA